jgi:hypothetical protein
VIKEMRRWLDKLEATVKELAEKYNQDPETVEEAWEEFWYDDGAGYDEDWGGQSIEIFRKSYAYRMEDGEYEEPDDTESEYTRSRVTIQPIVGADKTFFYIKEGIEGHTGDCFDADKEGIERLKQVVDGREIDWVNGYNASTNEDLTVVEFNRYVDMYLKS